MICLTFLYFKTMAQVNFITREVSFTEEELKKIAEAKKSVKVRMTMKSRQKSQKRQQNSFSVR